MIGQVSKTVFGLVAANITPTPEAIRVLASMQKDLNVEQIENMVTEHKAALMESNEWAPHGEQEEQFEFQLNGHIGGKTDLPQFETLLKEVFGDEFGEVTKPKNRAWLKRFDLVYKRAGSIITISKKDTYYQVKQARKEQKQLTRELLELEWSKHKTYSQGDVWEQVCNTQTHLEFVAANAGGGLHKFDTDVKAWIQECLLIDRAHKEDVPKEQTDQAKRQRDPIVALQALILAKCIQKLKQGKTKENENQIVKLKAHLVGILTTYIRDLERQDDQDLQEEIDMLKAWLARLTEEVKN